MATAKESTALAKRPSEPQKLLGRYQGKIAQIRQFVAGLKIKNKDDERRALDGLARIKAISAEWMEYTKESVEAAHRAHVAAKKIQNDICVPLEQQAKILTQIIGAWGLKERARIAAEAAKVAEQNRKLREKEAAAAARVAVSEGASKQEIATIKQEILSAPLPAPEETKPLADATLRDNWSAEIFDVILFLGWINENPDERHQFIDVAASEKLLRGMAVAQKSGFALPGVRARNTPSVLL